MKSFGLRLSLVAIVSTHAQMSPVAFPLMKQCDERWGNDLMDDETICQVGCLMSSTAEAIRGYNISIGNSESDPGVLNEWLRENGGYDGSNDMIEEVVPYINQERISWPDDGMHRTNDISYETVSDYITAGRVVICNVLNGGHFVLSTGTSEDGDTIYVNDSGFNTTQYSYSQDVVGFRIFDMN